MSFLPVMTYLYGIDILLTTQPLDPRDLFRGDYVSLRFTINEVDRSLFPDELKFEPTFEEYRNKDLYAILTKKGEYYVVDRLSFTKPQHPYYLKAKVNLYAPLNEEYLRTVYVNYQIDRYFVPERTGKDLEELARKGQLVARVKIWRGYPLLISVFPKKV
ncbi:hypothetical protein BHF71_07280 [Vulcanibacillus modesticaldus]|uniref:Uncharacterized protein n=2 Tax=Vulcanibacillus modesticaldus TaxID=337097 RepID=A0A1D2YW35_9BACI|nr:hypothetical protein BHF71_07280 [Vulcanibacillus modesticaldus]